MLMPLISLDEAKGKAPGASFSDASKVEAGTLYHHDPINHRNWAFVGARHQTAQNRPRTHPLYSHLSPSSVKYLPTAIAFWT